MNRTVFEEYKKFQAADGVWSNPGSFACAFRAARDHRQSERPKLEWKESRHGEIASLKLDGFDVTVEIRPSPDRDWALDGLGKFTDKRPARDWRKGGRATGYEIGVIDRFDGDKNRNRNEYRYFIPDNSYDEHFKSLRQMNYGKLDADVLARKYVKEDYKRAEKIAEGELGEWDVIVKVYKKGVELSDGCLGMGVIENLDKEREHVSDTAWDCIVETVDEAKKTLESLRSDDDEDSENKMEN